MKKVFVTICFIIACVMSAVAQEYRVESFEFIPNDLTARMEPRSDRNGRVCGVVKIHVADAIVDVEGPVIGEIVVKGFEKRVYLAHDAKQFILYFQNHVPLKVTFDDFYIPSITNKTTYLLKLKEVKGESQSTLAATDGKVSETSETSSVPRTEPATNHDVSNDSIRMQTIEKVQQLARTARLLSDNTTTNDSILRNVPDFTESLTDENVPVSTTQSSNTINGYEYVDLGLPSGLKWATCNVGASKPEEAGDYFAWGETSPKSKYIEKNSLTYKKKLSKLKSMGIIDADGNLTMAHDAANVNWGSSWRMPTKSEIEELVGKCKWEWTTQGRIKGCMVTGPNGNSIFLPATGTRLYSALGGVQDYAYYWSATAYDAYKCQFTESLYVSSKRCDNVPSLVRCEGNPIRPVTK